MILFSSLKTPYRIGSAKSWKPNLKKQLKYILFGFARVKKTKSHILKGAILAPLLTERLKLMSYPKGGDSSPLADRTPKDTQTQTFWILKIQVSQESRISEIENLKIQNFKVFKESQKSRISRSGISRISRISRIQMYWIC